MDYLKLVLDHMRQDVERFEGKGKIPGKLKGQWEEDKVRINKLLRKQRHLYRVLFLSLTGCFAYGFIRFLFVIKTLQIYCG